MVWFVEKKFQKVVENIKLYISDFCIKFTDKWCVIIAKGYKGNIFNLIIILWSENCKKCFNLSLWKISVIGYNNIPKLISSFYILYSYYVTFIQNDQKIVLWK